MSFDAARPGSPRAAPPSEPGFVPAPELQAVLDALPLGVCVFGADGRLALWNRRAEALIAPGAKDGEFGRFGFGDVAERLLRRRYLDREAPRRLIAWVAAAPPRAPLAVELRERDGRTLDARAEDLPGGGFLLSFQNVSSERDALRALEAANAALEGRVRERHDSAERAREAAERASEAKTRFLVAAGHDLLQPLNAARLFLEALRDNDPSAGQAHLIGRLSSALDSVGSQIGALIDIARLDSGETPVRSEAVPLARLLDPLRDEFGALAARKGLRLTVRESRAVVRSDGALLRRVLQNLVSNAVRYTPAGRVLVGVRRRPGGRIAIEVRDTGPGIPEDQQEAVFEEFRRFVPASEAEESPGMGLGLAIVQRICALLGHDVEMRSVPGRGTRFRVVLPLEADAPPRDAAGAAARAAVARAEAGAASSVDLRGMTVLALAPEGPARAELIERLRGWGAAPLAADGLAEAAEALAGLGGPPEAILAAPLLPEGAEALELIRTLRAWFGPCPAAVLVDDHVAEPALGRAAEEEDVDILPPDDDGGQLRAALSVMRGG